VREDKKPRRRVKGEGMKIKTTKAHEGRRKGMVRERLAILRFTVSGTTVRFAGNHLYMSNYITRKNINHEGAQRRTKEEGRSGE
jgi:hypothetical protein